MKRHPSLAIRLLGAATRVLALPTGVPLAAPVQLAQAQQPAPQQPAPQQPAPQTTPLTVPVQQAPAVPDEARRCGDDRRAYVEAGIAALYAGLLLTPAQQTLWPPVETALRDLAATRGGMRRGGGREEGGREGGFADPVARLKERGARLVARGQAMEKLADASPPLLAALAPEQKERVPRLLRRIMHRPMMGGDRRGMAGRGMGERGMGGRGMEGRGMEGRGMEGRERFRGGDGERYGRMDDGRR